jgi:hypothetical protein
VDESRNTSTPHWRRRAIVILAGLVIVSPVAFVDNVLLERRAQEWERELTLKSQEMKRTGDLLAWLDDQGAAHRITAESPDVLSIERLVWRGLSGTRPHFAFAIVKRDESEGLLHTEVFMQIRTGHPTLLPGPRQSIWFDRALRFMPFAILVGIIALAVIVLERRAWRLNRARCPDCGYPIGMTDVCSECGATLERDKLPGAAREHLKNQASANQR